MTEYRGSDWADSEFVNTFLDSLEIKIPQRRRMFELIKSFYLHFLGENGNRVLDLGCGNGVLTQELLSVDSALTATLVDGSEEMLNNAKIRFRGQRDITYIHTTFEELMMSDQLLPEYDLVISSLAIHHLPFEEKKRLFKLIHSHLVEGGYFINIDCVLPPSSSIESWYLKLWSEWTANRCSDKMQAERYVSQIIDHHLEEGHHSNLDTLDVQLEALKEIGYEDVDCMFKEGVLAIYSGKK